MNTKILSLMVAMLFFATNAFGYTSGQSNPPAGAPELEFRSVKKSETAGFSDAISKGHILTYDIRNTNDGYTVTRVGGNNVASANIIACVAPRAIATGDTAIYRCVSKGYVDFLRYDATTPIAVGSKICADASGVAVVCAACSIAGDGVPPGAANNCRFGTATENSPIVALEAKASGTGSDLKVLIKSR